MHRCTRPNVSGRRPCSEGRPATESVQEATGRTEQGKLRMQARQQGRACNKRWGA